MILLTGVTGRIGSSAARYLNDQGIPFRALARDPKKVTSLAAAHSNVVQADLLECESLANAMSGITAALLVTPNSETQLEMEQNFARAAVEAGVTHIVKISSLEAIEGATAPFPKIHLASEAFIRSLGVRHTMLRPNFFMQNLLMHAQAIAHTNSFTLPLGDARIAMIDARDVGIVAARCLVDTESTQSEVHELSGQEPLSFDQVADRMSRVLGRQISYVRQSHAEFRAFLGKIIPNPWHVNAVCELFEQIAAGSLDAIAPETKKLLGGEPRSIDEFIADFARAFTPA